MKLVYCQIHKNQFLLLYSVTDDEHMKHTNSSRHLDKHILRSYSTLRWFMGIFGLALPILLVFGGIIRLWWLPTPLEVQNSLSAYYHAGSGCISSMGVYRDLFVGLLAAISFCLIIYSGFGKLEDWLLNFAGIFLAGVAFFPTSWPESQVIASCQTIQDFQKFEASKFLGLPLTIHTISAVLFFITITAVNVFTSMDTVHLIQDSKKKKFWIRIYRFARFLMPISLGFVLLIRLITGTSIIGEGLILWIEWAGIWAFSIYWLIKSVEILRSNVDIDIINGKVRWGSPSNSGNRKKLQRYP